MDNLDKLIFSVAGQLGGYYNDRVYVGGSYGTNKALFTALQINDVDIFLLTPKQMCDWATLNILQSIFDVTTVEEIKDYKIFEEYRRYTCLKDGVKFDIIFINTDLHGLFNSTASDLSKFYHKYVGGVEHLVLSNHKEAQKAVQRLIWERRCVVKPSICTDKHYNKIKTRCENLGLELDERN